MIRQAHPSLRRPIAWLDAASPFFILAATLAFFLEFTPLRTAGPALPVLHAPILPFIQSVLDAFFVLSFLLRWAASPKRAWFFRDGGWTDLLAALPGLLWVLAQGPLPQALSSWLPLGRLAVFARFFRLLQWFPLLRRLRGGGPRTYSRAMASSALVLAIGVGLLPVAERILERRTVHAARESIGMYEKITGSFSLAVQLLPPKQVLAWQQGQNYARPPDETLSPSEYAALARHADVLAVRLDAARSVVLHDAAFLRDRDQLALALVLALGALVIALALRSAWLEARASRRIQVAMEAIRTGDDTRLMEEARRICPDGEFDAEPGEDASLTLVKSMARLATERARQGRSGGAIPAAGDAVSPQSAVPRGVGEAMPSAMATNEARAEIDRAVEHALARFMETFRAEIAEDLRAQARATAVEAVRISAKSLVDYLKKHGYGA